MKTRTHSANSGAGISTVTRWQGFTLIECLVYLGAVTVVLGIAWATCWRCWDAQLEIRRDADGFVRALHAGEQWRADIRAADAPIRHTTTNGALQLRIPTANGRIDYRLVRGKLYRQTGPTGRHVVVLERVKTCRMEPDPRQKVTAWRWELELRPGPRKPQLRPRFTFEAVPGFGIRP